EAESVREQVDSLARLSLYESRLTRMFQTTLKQFLALRAGRLECEDRDMKDAAKVLKHCRANQLPFNPAEVGFVFSVEEVEAWTKRRDVIEAARATDAIAFNRRFFANPAGKAAAPALC